MSATMRAKMVVKNVSVGNDCELLEFAAVYKKDGYPADGSDENNSFARWTPHAELKMTITNKNLLGAIKEGEEYYLNFTIADGDK